MNKLIESVTAQKHVYIVLLSLWIILISVWTSLDSIFVPEFGPMSLDFISQGQTQVFLAVCFFLSIPVAIFLEGNIDDSLILPSMIVFLLIWFFSSGISYLSTVMGQQQATNWEAVSALSWGVMFYALIQLVAVFYLVFYSCIAILYCYVLSKLMERMDSES